MKKNQNIDTLKKDIKDLENENIEIIIKKKIEYYEEKKKEIDELKEINNKYEQKIQELEKN